MIIAAAMGALIGVELVVSQRLQLVLGLSPLEAGLMIAALPLAGITLPSLGATRVLWSAGSVQAGTGRLPVHL